MNDKAIIFAKLAGIYKSLSLILGPQGKFQRLHINFDKGEIAQIFNIYLDSVNNLKKLEPKLYSDIPIRILPDPSVEGYIGRDFVEKQLFHDLEYIFEVNANYSANVSKSFDNNRIFISHGTSHDWMKVQTYIEKDLELETLELAQEPNEGRTVLQKLNEESDKCSYSVVVMTGDDIDADGISRARENVMHEIGFFQGKYGLKKVCLLHEEGTNVPSNIHGLVYIPFPKGVIDATFGSLSRELKSFKKV